MSDTSSVSSVLQRSAGLQLELEVLRDQRDLYRSLLLSEPAALAPFVPTARETVERIRSALRTPTRDAVTFRGKIQRLLAELDNLGESLLELHLPTVESRLLSARSALREIETRSELSGNDLLPVMVVLEELCSHLIIACDCAAVHVAPAEDQQDFDEVRRHAQSKLAIALRQLVEKFSAEQGKQVALVTMGLDAVPEDWLASLFDMLGALLRNGIEHGIEPPETRRERGKPEEGTLLIEFSRVGQSFELSVQDDGGGLDAQRIADAAVKLKLMDMEAAEKLDPGRAVTLIFQQGLSTAADPIRRGHGMQIVRDYVQRLGGRVQVATKRGQYTRYRFLLPIPYEDTQEQAAQAS